MNKRILSILLCLTLVASLLVLAIPVSAASAKEITVTADKTTAAPGDEITLTLSVGPVTDIANITTHVVLPDGLTFVSGLVGEEYDASDRAVEVNRFFGFMFSGCTYDAPSKTYIFDGSGYSNKSTDATYDVNTFVVKVDDDATGTLSVGFNDAEFVLGNETGADLTGEYTCTGVDITVEPKPTETQPTETQPTETQPTETQPTETQPTETQPTETQPTETQPTETEAHIHSIIAVPEVAATTEAEGVKAHYECTECGMLFWDATGTIEITDVAELVIPKLAPVETTTVETTTVETTADETTTVETTADETTAPETASEATPDEATASEAITPTKPVSNDSAATPDSTKDTSSPQTGDSTHMYLWTLIMLASLVGACAVVIIAKRRGIFTK